MVQENEKKERPILIRMVIGIAKVIGYAIVVWYILSVLGFPLGKMR